MRDLFREEADSKNEILANVAFLFVMSMFAAMLIGGLLWATFELLGLDTSWMGWEEEGLIGPLFPRIWSSLFVIGIWLFVISGLISIGKKIIQFFEGGRDD